MQVDITDALNSVCDLSVLIFLIISRIIPTNFPTYLLKNLS
jgi:hypothetical protein